MLRKQSRRNIHVSKQVDQKSNANMTMLDYVRHHRRIESGGAAPCILALALDRNVWPARTS